MFTFNDESDSAHTTLHSMRRNGRHEESFPQCYHSYFYVYWEDYEDNQQQLRVTADYPDLAHGN